MRKIFSACLLMASAVANLIIAPTSLAAAVNINVGSGVDPEQILKLLMQIAQDVNSTNSLTDAMKKQLHGDIGQEIATLTGSYQMGAFMDSASDFNARNWSPGDWESALRESAGAGNAAYRMLMQNYEQKNPSLTADEFSKGADSTQTNYYTNSVATNRAASVTSTYEFNDVANQLTQAHELSEKIDTTQNLKQATDLNSRINAQQVYLLGQVLKMQSIQTEEMVQQNQAKLNDMAADSQFNQ